MNVYIKFQQYFNVVLKEISQLHLMYVRTLNANSSVLKNMGWFYLKMCSEN